MTSVTGQPPSLPQLVDALKDLEKTNAVNNSKEKAADSESLEKTNAHQNGLDVIGREEKKTDVNIGSVFVQKEVLIGKE